MRAGKPTLWVRVLDLLMVSANPVTRAEVMSTFKVGAGEAQRALKQLCERGQARKVALGQYTSRRAA